MSWLLRYIVLPLLLLWLWNDGYKNFTSINGDDHISEPTQISKTNDKNIAEARDYIPPTPSADKNSPSLESTEEKTILSLPKPATKVIYSENVCDTLKQWLTDGSHSADLSIDTVRRSGSCFTSRYEYRKNLQAVMTKFNTRQELQKAIETTEIFIAQFPSDPYPYFFRSDLSARLRDHDTAIDSFVQGYRLSPSKTSLKPRYFMTALKSMQSIGLICEQLSILKPMSELEEVPKMTRTKILTQFDELNSRCAY